MKAAVVYGTMHKGSTYHCVQLLLTRLGASQPLTVTEFFLPHDMPHFCSSCFSCFLHGEETCPHADSVRPIAQALEEADVIILASPSYVCDVSGQMKALLDHLGYQWLPHRPRASMFRKVGVAVSTAAGAGTGHTVKTLKKSLTFWGVRKSFALKANVAAMTWQDVKPEIKAKIQKKADTLGKRITAASAKPGKPPLFTRILFAAMKGMQKGSDWNKTDRDYWVGQGWLDGKKPW